MIKQRWNVRIKMRDNIQHSETIVCQTEKSEPFQKQNTLLQFWACVLQIFGITKYCIYFKSAAQNHKHMAAVRPTESSRTRCRRLEKPGGAVRGPNMDIPHLWGGMKIMDGKLSLCFLPWRNKLNLQNTPDGWIHRKHTGDTLLHGLPAVRENRAL